MKTFLSTLFLLIACRLFVYSQNVDIPRDSTSGSIAFIEVVKVEGVSQDQLYSRGREWFSKTFTSADKVLEMDDKAAGKLIGKAYSQIRMDRGTLIQMWYTLSVYMKEGRYKYELTDIVYKTQPTGNIPQMTFTANELFNDGKFYKKNGEARPVHENYRTETIKEAQKIADSLKLAMAAKGTVKDDW